MAKNLQFKTNSRHIGQLGRELVTDFVTALVELVKNSYGADAGSVQIRIENANTPFSRIIVTDTGSGMTQEEFENKWMTIGTNNKVSEPYSKKGRKRAGKGPEKRGLDVFLWKGWRNGPQSILIPGRKLLRYL